ncbi:MAG: CapA family protein [Deltaproteobacteria bacterium]|jgi:poly-gamma-glutamate capsule biosynthesis protein CapA/YwtB (metallophosphatase superfamily)|nr:CapA family protein [Deltaproteobacteria bacterium]
MTRFFFRSPLLALWLLVFFASGCVAQNPPRAGGSAGAPPGAATDVITVAAMGDIMLGTENLLPPDGAKDFFADVTPYLKGRDIVFGNLEGPLTDRGYPAKDTSTGRSFCFRTPPSYGQVLKDAGFTILSMANNHALDYGEEGRAQTVEVLDGLGIKRAGAPLELTEDRVRGHSIVYFGLAPNVGSQNINDIPGAVAMVKEALKNDPAALVVVSFHGGAEGSGQMSLPDGPETFLGERRGDLRVLARALIDAGAAMVLGHGPHVPRGVEIYRDRLIAYSLGNFATANGINVKGANGLAPLLLAEMDGTGRILGWRIVSFRQKPNQGPKADPTDEAALTIERLSEALK